MADANNCNGIGNIGGSSGYVQVGDPLYYQPWTYNSKSTINGECQVCGKRSSSYNSFNDLSDCHIQLGEWKRSFTACAQCGEEVITAFKKVMKNMLKEP